MTRAKQVIDNCSDCDSRSFPYNGAHYVRFQLGVYYSKHPADSLSYHVFMPQNGFFTGGTVSYQEFFSLGAEPYLERDLTFAYTIGWGP